MTNWKTVSLILSGVLVGMLLGLPESSTSASAPQYKECVWYCGFDFTKKAHGVESNATKVPAGWTPVGGAGQQLCALICR